MKIYSWNVNSLRSCETAFLDFIDRYSPDIVMLQELRAHPDQLSFFLKLVPGYGCLFNDSGRAGYAGTAIYYKDSLPVSEVTNELGDDLLEAEGRAIFLRIGDFSIYNFYIPNGNSSEERLKYKLKYHEKILNLAQSRKNEKVILGGDFNVAHTSSDLYLGKANNSGFLPEERRWFDEMLAQGFHDTFRMFEKRKGFYSWWHLRDPERKANNGWRFDYFLASDPLKDSIMNAGISREVFGSDHCPIWVEIEE
ncbi:exodeoxyribonuclease III [Candidatus Nomurabacteria bacterium]|nr:exodeoxyribonuclease III [Candidatus Nomurabacteria bacterium]